MQTETKKTVEELLKPRYIIENEWFDCPYLKGTILTRMKDSYEFSAADEHHPFSEEDLVKYPYLTRKLEWWQERSESEMPEYVKWHPDRTSRSRPTKVKEWKLFDDGPGFRYVGQDKGGYVAAKYSLPCDESEYLAYINSTTPTEGAK